MKFNLSDKIDCQKSSIEEWSFLYVEDVKEFIRLLKEDYERTLYKTGLDTNREKSTAIKILVFEIFEEIIDELAGRDLK